MLDWAYFSFRLCIGNEGVVLFFFFFICVCMDIKNKHMMLCMRVEKKQERRVDTIHLFDRGTQTQTQSRLE
jgi:hypothetical protein